MVVVVTADFNLDGKPDVAFATASVLRVYPGKGTAPLGEILRTLRDSGYRGALSLELFNNELYKQDPKKVAKVGLDHMKSAVRAAFA